MDAHALPALSSSNSSVDFGKVAGIRLSKLRCALADLIATLPGDTASASDLQRTLKTNMNLSWKVYRVVSATSPYAAGPHVPGPGAMKIFFKAAAKRGLPKQLIQAALLAFEELEVFVAEQAGDRATFDSMVSKLSGGEREIQADLQHRRAAFRANSHTFGIQAKAQMKCVMLHASDDPAVLDIACIEGHIQLRRLRQTARMVVACSHVFVVACSRLFNDDGSSRRVSRMPLDDNAETDSDLGVALLTPFCSEPIPEVRSVSKAGDVVLVEFLSDGVGHDAAVSPVTGWYARSAVPRYGDGQNSHAHFILRPRIPSELLVFDLCIHRDLVADGINPEMIVFGGLFGEFYKPGDAFDDHDVVSPRELVIHMGQGPSVQHTPGIPRYAEMIRYTCDRLGWEAEEFDVFRCQIPYPVLPSSVLIEFGLPDNPDA